MQRRLCQRSHNYLGALDWLFSQDLPLLKSGIDYLGASVICRSLDQQVFSDDHIPRLGLECDLSRSKIDLAFSGGPELFANCEDSFLNEVGSRLVSLRNENLAHLLPPLYFVEYDFCNLGYLLAGGFVKLNSFDLNLNECCELINIILVKLGHNILEFSDGDHEILEALKIMQYPTQLGFMSGRGNFIKIMGEVSRNHKHVASEINRMQEKCGFASDIDAVALSDTLSQSRVNGSVFSISYDYDLGEHAILPRFSIEVMPTLWNKRYPLVERWSQLKSTISLFKVDEASMILAEEFSIRLPYPDLDDWARNIALYSEDKMYAQPCGYGVRPSHFKLSITHHSTSIKAYCSVEPIA